MMSNNNQKQKPLYLNTNLRLIFGVTLMAVLGVSSSTPVFSVIIEKLYIAPQSI